ncbi:hypothetical protein BAE44_0025799 [Dichanthelium oligosanthes]|uniref:DUF4408 domain-containing protein n=1 Tax=Dichanthelium oligosanthes TaxID=888268 RepID=A0A1E5UJW5_9POAL|nr:hypothetical protein BAE44_0025799 [Dichanthelium oligosanthes]
MDSLLKATAIAMVVFVVAARAEAAAGSSYMSAIATADFLMSPIFLWVTANAIVFVIWVLSSSSRRGITDDKTTSSSADGEVVHDAVDSFYTSASEYESFSDAGSARREDAAVSSKRLAREARAAARRADRPRVRKKPAAGQDAPTPRAVKAAAAAARDLDDEIRRAGTPVTPAATTEPRPGDGDDEDLSMDSMWQSIVQRRAARPVVVQKSGSWGNDELPRLQRVAETAATTRREMRKSASAVNKAAAVAPKPPQPSVPAAVRELGWRRRDELVTISPDELLRRAESFIRRQREHLRLQRQESEQRQLQLQRRLLGPPLIRAGV